MPGAQYPCSCLDLSQMNRFTHWWYRVEVTDVGQGRNESRIRDNAFGRGRTGRGPHGFEYAIPFIKLSKIASKPGALARLGDRF
jgi:hypothetical protein